MCYKTTSTLLLVVLALTGRRVQPVKTNLTVFLQFCPPNFVQLSPNPTRCLCPRLPGSFPSLPAPKEILQGPARPACPHPVPTSRGTCGAGEDPTPSPCCQGTALQKRPCQCWVIAQLWPITSNSLRPRLLVTHLRLRLPF